MALTAQMLTSDAVFAGSIPQLYDEYMVPLIFEVYADDLVKRAVGRNPTRVLELAAGTGVVTRRLASAITAPIIATDLNPGMLERAAAVGTSRPVEWRQADAMKLPFDDSSFDLVLCQFGAMFFPDKGKAFAETRRVLRPGGTFLFNVWDRIEENEFANAVLQALNPLFPTNKLTFMARTPHGYFDHAQISKDLRDGGFSNPATIDTVTARSRAASARVPALALCQGTPMRAELESRGASLSAMTDHATAAIAARFGEGPVEGKIQGFVVTVSA
ncbi:MAG: methyltransferase domain-containing protein [Archangium sp.]|nr:methyltransferase domain-containing protein [Archangium sp.]